MTGLREVENKKTWERFVLEQKPNIFLQSWNWGEFHKNLGEKIFRLGFWEGKKLVGTALLIKEKAKRGAYLSCPGGPLIDWNEGRYFRQFIEEIRDLGKREGAVFIRVRPSIFNNRENRQLFKKVGFIRAPMHMHAETTWQLDLASSEEDLLAGMRKTTRYCVRKAIKKGVKIRLSKNSDDVSFLYQLQMETARRHRFVPFSQEFLEKQFRVLERDDQASLFLAEYQGKVLAASMIVFYGDTAVYHYSGSNFLARRVYASHLIQWEAIKEAKKRGCAIYNFWGIAPSGDSRHRFAGVTTFKKGFGGKRIDWLYAHDWPLSKRYWLVFVFESLRRVCRRL